MITVAQLSPWAASCRLILRLTLPLLWAVELLLLGSPFSLPFPSVPNQH